MAAAVRVCGLLPARLRCAARTRTAASRSDRHNGVGDGPHCVGVGGDLRAHVRAVDEHLGEAADGGLAEAHADHELGAGVGGAVAARDAGDAEAVVVVRGDGAATVRVVLVVAEQVRVRVVGVVVAVAVVDVLSQISPGFFQMLFRRSGCSMSMPVSMTWTTTTFGLPMVVSQAPGTLMAS